MENGNIVARKTGRVNDSLEEKRRIVAELYTLRAGLSEVAAEVDAKREAKRQDDLNFSKESNDFDSKIYETTVEKEHAEREFNMLVDYFDIIRLSENLEQREAWDKKRNKKDKRKANAEAWKTFMISLAGVFLSGVIMLVCGLWLNLVILMGIANLAGVIFLLCLLPTLVESIKKAKNVKKVYREKEKKLEKRYAQRKKKAEHAEEYLKNAYNGDVESAKQAQRRVICESDKKKRELEKQKKQWEATREASPDILLHEETAKRIYAGLEERYATLVDPRDWENLDIIIYSYETGRADTIKEALCQVDAVRRTEQIVTEVKKASQNVATSIKQGARSLEYSMQSSMARLADGLAEQNRALLSSQNEFQQKVGARLSQIATSAELSTALQQKAELNSREIMAQIGDLQANSNFECYGV